MLSKTIYGRASGENRRPWHSDRNWCNRRCGQERGWAMGRLDWCQNKSWNADIEAAFFAKLARAKNKAWYLRIQAASLVSSQPQAALGLLDRYFALGADSSQAEAHFNRGRAHAALRDVDAAIAAFEAAIACEDANPLFRTWVYVELPVLIATERKRALYGRAVELLTKNRDRPLFPAEFYKWHGAHALILHDRGETAQASDEARQALEAAGMTHSGFQYHPEVGLVTDTSDTFGTRLKQIAGEPRASPPRWRRWM
jgi:tetratricopeptide (TPR) repeat protein